jgi:cell division septal protein FtsQ
MWSKRKRKNRRFEREHILDVKVESRQLRAMRLRLAARVFARVFGTAVVFYLVWRGGDWLLDEFLFKNPAFAIQRIDVETDGILPRAQLRACAGVKLGDNLLALDLSRIQRDLQYHPWVQSAAVERVRPNTLKIRVIEREPIARTVLFEPGGPGGKPNGVLFYFDEEGYVMLPLEAHRVEASACGFDSLPMLTGLSPYDVHPGHPVESRQIQAALRLVCEFSRSPMLGLADLTTVDLSLPDVLQVSTAQAALITFGIENLERQLYRWRLVHDHASRAGKGIATLDLSVSNNVPARWLEAAAIPLPHPKPPKLSAYRKKHV